jgi:hypothetical protein
MRIAFDHAVTLNALNRIIHFQRGAPILSERIGLPPSIMAALPKAMIFAGSERVATCDSFTAHALFLSNFGRKAES